MRRTELQFGTISGEDSLYIPVKARRSHSQNQNQNQNQNQKQQKQAQRRVNGDGCDSSETKASVFVSDNTGRCVDSVVDCSKASSNLERFLESTTPFVPAQYFSKKTMRSGWRTCDVEFQHYFALSDLWESFTEWSAYGAGVPLVLNGNDSVVQYYVPYLSAIQLYGQSSTTAKSRQVGEDSDSESYRDSSSDGSIEYEIEKGVKCLSIRNGQSSPLQEGFSSDDGETQNSRGVLLFEYLERDLPYTREPLADKISDLASRYPDLMTLRSCDLLPASWLAVAWYPIYRIPTGPTLKDLDTCFLTYHSLSTPTTGNGNSQSPSMVFPRESDGVPKFSLTVFGMASYKLKGSMWIRNGMNEWHQVHSLMQATDNWLRRLRVAHPDFQFFASHGMYCT